MTTFPRCSAVLAAVASSLSSLAHAQEAERATCYPGTAGSHVLYADHFAFHASSTRNVLAFEVWVYRRGAGGSREVITSTLDRSAAAPRGWELDLRADGRARFTWANAATGELDNLVSARAVSFERWTHLALVFNPNSTAQIIVDGADAAATDVSGIGYPSSDEPFSLGANGRGGAPFAGCLQEARLFLLNRPRTPADVRDTMFLKLRAGPDLAAIFPAAGAREIVHGLRGEVRGAVTETLFFVILRERLGIPAVLVHPAPALDGVLGFDEFFAPESMFLAYPADDDDGEDAPRDGIVRLVHSASDLYLHVDFTRLPAAQPAFPFLRILLHTQGPPANVPAAGDLSILVALGGQGSTLERADGQGGFIACEQVNDCPQVPLWETAVLANGSPAGGGPAVEARIAKALLGANLADLRLAVAHFGYAGPNDNPEEPVFAIAPAGADWRRPASWLPARLADDTVEFAVDTDAADLELRGTLFPESQSAVTHVRLAGALDSVPVGHPELPYVLREVALPRGVAVRALEVVEENVVELPGHPLVSWRTRAQPGGANTRPPRLPEFELDLDGEPVYYARDDEAEPMSPEVAQHPVWPPAAVEETEVYELGDLDVHVLRIQPVRWRPQGGVIRLATRLRVTLHHSGGAFETPNALDFRAREEGSEVREIVVNASDLPPLPPSRPPADFEAWYLIITDDRLWNENQTPGFPIGSGLIDEFERLAQWKREKGLKAAVVTVSDIFAGRYGEFDTPGVLDTQEVIRNFMKHALREWRTRWLLIGGDVQVVPPRKVVSNTAWNSYHNYVLADKEKPDLDKAYLLPGGSRVRIHTRFGYIDDSTRVFVARRTGTAFQRTGLTTDAFPSWGFMTDDTYITPAEEPTEYILLAGPPADLTDTSFHPVYYYNSIPTDLYYGSLESPYYNQPGKHDWDLNANGLYGQHDGGVSLDGVDYHAEVEVGRAAVNTRGQARAFVDKVVAYETYTGVSPEFGRSVLFAADNWGGGPHVYADAAGANPPDKNRYFHPPGATYTLCRFASAPGAAPAEYEVVAYDAARETYWNIPYKPRDAPAIALGFYYTTDDTYSERAELVFDFLFPVRIPLPTSFVRVEGPEAEIVPEAFFFDSTAPDDAVTQKEEARALLATAAPALDRRSRLYVDLEDTPDYPAADLARLTASAMEAELTAGYNVVSITGHGSYNGVARLSIALATTLRNGFRGGIVFADSCLTNQFDEPKEDPRVGNTDALSEELLQSAIGGCAAFVGCTRECWIGTSDDLERLFWGGLVTAARSPGFLLNRTRVLHRTDYEVWSQYALNLLGDPQMELWIGTPRRMQLDAAVCYEPGETLRVTCRYADASPVEAAFVALTTRDGELTQRLTSTLGEASFPTAGIAAGATLTLVATKAGHVPSRIVLAPCAGGRPRFHRGDPNGDGSTDISDALHVLSFLFTGGAAPACRESADANNDAALDLSDAIFVLGFLFLGSPPPPLPGPPGPNAPCGPDVDPGGSAGDLGCAVYEFCADA